MYKHERTRVVRIVLTGGPCAGKSSSLQHFTEAAKREGFATVPGVTWADVGALRDVRGELVLSILQGWVDKFPNEPTFVVPECLKAKVAAGKLGRKTGEGFYKWDGDKPLGVAD